MNGETLNDIENKKILLAALAAIKVVSDDTVFENIDEHVGNNKRILLAALAAIKVVSDDTVFENIDEHVGNNKRTLLAALELTPKS